MTLAGLRRCRLRLEVRRVDRFMAGLVEILPVCLGSQQRRGETDCCNEDQVHGDGPVMACPCEQYGGNQWSEPAGQHAGDLGGQRDAAVADVGRKEFGHEACLWAVHRCVGNPESPEADGP